MRRNLHFIFDSILIICASVLLLNSFTKYFDLSEKYRALLFLIQTVAMLVSTVCSDYFKDKKSNSILKIVLIAILSLTIIFMLYNFFSL